MAINVSKLRFFQHTNLRPDLNYKVDSLTDYLDDLVDNQGYKDSVITDFQFIKHKLNLTIKIHKTSTTQINYALSPEAENSNTLATAENFDYVLIQNMRKDDSTYTNLDRNPIPYFVTERKWIAEDTIEYTLYMDTLNTLVKDYDYTWDKKTIIKREHKDRLVETSETHKYLLTPDFFPEQINPTKYKLSETVLRDASYNGNLGEADWYLVYKSVSTAENAEIKCYAMPSKNISLYPPYIYETNSALLNRWNYFLYSIETGLEIFIEPISTANAPDELYYKIGGTGSYYGFAFRNTGTGLGLDYAIFTYTGAGNELTIAARGICKAIHISRSNHDVTCTYKYNDTTDTDPVDTITTINTYTNGTLIFTNKTMASIRSINKADSLLNKIVKIPYMPFKNICSDYVNYSIWASPAVQYGEIYSGIKAIEFINACDYIEGAPVYNILSPFSILKKTIASLDTSANRDNQYESKLYSSEFFTLKFVYDTFGMAFNLENLNILSSEYDSFEVNEICSKAMSSKFMFEFPQYKNHNYSVEDYDNILCISKNNEVPIYNSAYLNYIKTGYNYDMKNKSIANRQAILNAGIGIINAGSQGNLVSVGQSALSAITSIAERERSMERKLTELEMQGVSTSGADDIDLTSYYSDNKAKIVKYQPDSVTRSMIADLFYYHGYKTNYMGIPSLNTRYWFNYIECEPVWKEISETIDADIIDDCQEKYRQGVTIFHKRDGEWNIAQTKENWETSLL